jgi:hypothetical protein
MLAVALGYTVQSRFVDHANFMTSGFDHTTQLAFSHNASAGRLLGLSEPQIANAMAMAAVSDASFAVVRAKPLSQWKEVLQTTQLGGEDMLPGCKTIGRHFSAAGTSPRRSSSSASAGTCASLSAIEIWKN